MARRISAASLLEGFGAGYNLVGQVARDAELRRINEAQPETIPGQQVPATETDPYAGAGGGLPANATPAQYALLGVKQDQPFTPEQAGRARQLAMAGVLEKFGDVQGGAQIRDRISANDARQAELDMAKQRNAREEVRFQREGQVFDRNQRLAAEDDQYRAERKQLVDSSTTGQRAKQFADATAQYQKDMQSYQEAVSNGDTSAQQPTPPKFQAPSIGESMLDYANMMAHDVKYGKATPEQLMKVAEVAKQLNDEGYTRALKLAQDNAPLTQVVASFNAGGKYQIDPNSIVSDKRVKRENGTTSRVISYRNPDGSLQSIDTLAELDSLGKAGDVFQRAFQAHQMANQDKQTAISGGHLAVAQAGERLREQEWQSGAKQREVNNEISDLQQQLGAQDETTPEGQQRIQQIQAKLQALKTGTRGGSMSPHSTAVQENSRSLAAVTGLDPQTATEQIVLKPEQAYRSYYEASLKVTGSEDAAAKAAAKRMNEDGFRRLPNGYWTRSSAAGGAPGNLPAPKSEADFKQLKPGTQYLAPDGTVRTKS